MNIFERRKIGRRSC